MKPKKRLAKSGWAISQKYKRGGCKKLCQRNVTSLISLQEIIFVLCYHDHDHRLKYYLGLNQIYYV